MNIETQMGSLNCRQSKLKSLQSGVGLRFGMSPLVDLIRIKSDEYFHKKYFSTLSQTALSVPQSLYV